MRIDNSYFFLHETKFENNDFEDDNISFFKRNNSDRDFFYICNNNTIEKNNFYLDDKLSQCNEKQIEEHMNNEVSISHQPQTQDDCPIVEFFDAQCADKINSDIYAEAQLAPCPNVYYHVEADSQENNNSNCEASNTSKSAAKKYPRKSKTTEYAYLLERKAFRMMRRYYKEKFEFEFGSVEYKKNLPIMTTEELNSIVCKFMEQEFFMLAKILSEKDYERTRDALKTIILCDRYRKKEKISEGLNYTPLRNVLHKYNTRNLIDFLSDASNSYLYTHFFLINGSKACEEQDDVQKDKLAQRMRHLMLEAANYLPREINTLFEDIYNSNTAVYYYF